MCFFHRAINGGKSKWNEDQSRAGTFFVRGTDKNQNMNESSPSPLSDEGAVANEEENLVSMIFIDNIFYLHLSVELYQCYQVISTHLIV